MPKYLLKVSYTADGVKGVLKDGGSARKRAAEAAVKSTGATLESNRKSPDLSFLPVLAATSGRVIASREAQCGKFLEPCPRAAS